MFWTSLFTAIGTVTVAALAIWLNIIREWHRRPKLEIQFSIGELFCRPALLPVGETVRNSYWARIKVRNRGRRTALNCRCRLENIYERDQQSNELKPFVPFDPADLHWVHHSWKDFGPTSLPPKAPQFADVFFGVEGQNSLNIRIEPIPRGIRSQIDLKGEYYVTITAYADNAEPCQETFRLKWNQEWDNIDMRQLTPDEVKRLPFPPEEPVERLVERLLFRKMVRKRLQGILKLILRNRNG